MGLRSDGNHNTHHTHCIMEYFPLISMATKAEQKYYSLRGDFRWESTPGGIDT